MQLKRPNALMNRPDVPNEDVDVPKNSASANMSAVTTPRAVSLKQASGTNDKDTKPHPTIERAAHQLPPHAKLNFLTKL